MNAELKVATLEILWKSLALFVLKTTHDPNARHYIWNTFENTVDALDITGMPEVEQLREQIRSYGQNVLQSVEGKLPPR